MSNLAIRRQDDLDFLEHWGLGAACRGKAGGLRLEYGPLSTWPSRSEEHVMDRLSEAGLDNGHLNGQTIPPSESKGERAAETEPASPRAAQGAAGPGLNAVLGDIVLLMSQSPAHRHLFLSDLEWMLLPPLMLRQARVFYAGKAPIAAALWASVSEEVEKRLEAGELRLRPQDWKSGDRLWLIELIAPGIFRNAKAVQALLNELARTAFGGKPFKLRRVNQQTGKLEKVKVSAENKSAEDAQANS